MLVKRPARSICQRGIRRLSQQRPTHSCINLCNVPFWRNFEHLDTCTTQRLTLYRVTHEGVSLQVVTGALKLNRARQQSSAVDDCKVEPLEAASC